MDYIVAPDTVFSSRAPLFSVRASRLILGIVLVTSVAFVAARATDRTELLMPINPNLEAAAIGLGVFAGLILDAAFLAVRRKTNGYRLLIVLAVIPSLCVMTMTYGARRLVEYRAFHGLPVITAPVKFTITGVRSGKGGHSLRLIGGPDQRTFSLGVSRDVYFAAQPGQHVVLPVQTGREGVQRMIPPPQAVTVGDLLP